MVKAGSGFTLIETLLAGLILFAVLAVASMSYSGAMGSSLKAQNRIEMAKSVPFILEKLRLDMRQRSQQSNNMSGNGQIMGTTYSWQAVIKQRGAAPSQLNQFTGKFEEGPKRFKLWEINLKLEYKGYETTKLVHEVTW